MSPALLERAERGHGTEPAPSAAHRAGSGNGGGTAARASAIYEGYVHHSRHEPVQHAFSYRIFMPLLDLGELPGLFDGIPFWSARRPAPARVRRRDHFGDPSVPLAEAVRAFVAAELGSAPAGPVRMLANPRYWGYGINPVAFFYVYGKATGGGAGPLEAIVAEVTNTPWGERRCYAVDAREAGRAGGEVEAAFDKQLHVSPFMPMEQRYELRANDPGESLRVRLANVERGRPVFEAGIELRRREITPGAMTALLLRYPPMTAATVARIYLNAARLKLKRVPFFGNPGTGRDGR